MIYRIEYITRNKRQNISKWVDNVSDSTEAVKKFMDQFFLHNPDDAVRINKITEIEMTGDMSLADVILGEDSQ